MSRNLVTVNTISNMQTVREALQTTHTGFPVLNSAGRFIGLVSRNNLIKLLMNKAFYDGTDGKPKRAGLNSSEIGI